MTTSKYETLINLGILPVTARGLSTAPDWFRRTEILGEVAIKGVKSGRLSVERAVEGLGIVPQVIEEVFESSRTNQSSGEKLLSKPDAPEIPKPSLKNT